ncbi:MAG TPA: flavodoxin domain-containing protein [Terriglobales bacterium]|nr:flavodoxin domain-containing protein [Terriglobales bacterium]
MRVLIVYASRSGATREIAERIAFILLRQGLEASVQPAQHADDPADYDVSLIGSATYYWHWMKTATKFLRRNRDVLANRPVWLFSSGSLGCKADGSQVRDTRAVAEPKEIAEFRQTIKPRGHRVFLGTLDPNKLGFIHRLMLKFPANRDKAPLPLGNFGDWNDVEDWAFCIARVLTPSANRAQLDSRYANCCS